MPKGKSEFPPEEKKDSQPAEQQGVPVEDAERQNEQLPPLTERLSVEHTTSTGDSIESTESEAQQSVEKQYITKTRERFEFFKDRETQEFLDNPKSTEEDKAEYLALRQAEQERFSKMDDVQKKVYLDGSFKHRAAGAAERRKRVPRGEVPAVGSAELPKERRAERRTQKETSEPVPERRSRKINLQPERTPGEWRKHLKKLIVEAEDKDPVTSVLEGTSERFKKLSEQLKLRDLNLSGKLRQLGINIFDDAKAAGRGIKNIVTNPLESLRAATSKVKDIGKYGAYFAKASWPERANKLKVDLVALTESYNKLPFRQKAYMTAALIGGSAVASAAALPTISSILAGAMYSMRGFGGAGFMLNRRKATERSGHFLFNKSEKVKNVYAALTGALYMGTTAAAGHWATDKLAHWLGNMFGHTPVHSVEVPKPVAEAKLPITPIDLHATEPSITISNPPTPSLVGETVTAAVPSPEIPTLSVEAQGGHGYEYMMKRLWEQLQQKHIDPSQYPEDSDIHKLLLADSNSIDKVVHQIAADPKHAFFNTDGTSVQINAGTQMSMGPDGEVHLSTGGHDVIKAPEDAPTTSSYPPGASPSAPEVPAAPETPVSDSGAPAETSPVSTPPEEAVSTTVIDSPNNNIAVSPNDLPIEQLHTAPIESPAPATPEIQAVKESAAVFNGHEMSENGASDQSTVPVEQSNPTPVAPLETGTIEHSDAQAPDTSADTHQSEQASVGAGTQEHLITNHFGTAIEPTKLHIYQSPDGKNIFAFGGAPEAQAKPIQDYLLANPKNVVFGTDDSGTYRLRYSLGPDGKLATDLPERTKGFLGFGSKFLKAPGPEDLKSLIQ